MQPTVCDVTEALHPKNGDLFAMQLTSCIRFVMKIN